MQQSLLEFERIGAPFHVDRACQLLRGLNVSEPVKRRARSGRGMLSERELQIARLVAEGLTNPKIAERLTLSSLTVTSHLHHIYTRLSLRSRAALARHVAETGLLSSQQES